MNMKKNTLRYTKANDDDKKCSTDEEENFKTMNVPKKGARKNNWQKLGNMPIGDGAEIRNPLLKAIFNKPGYTLPAEQNNSSSDGGSSTQQWQVTSKCLNSAYAHEHDDETFMHDSISRHSKLSFNKTPKDHNESHLENTSTPTLLMRSASFRQPSSSVFNANQINYVTLFGFVIGLIVSKLLQYLLVYFDWLLRQIKQLRDVFFGDGNIMDFFNFDDSNSRYDFRIKLLIMPVLAICCLLYFLVVIIHYGIRIMLADVPAFIMAMLHKVYMEI